ncbi:hypothetical protein M7I_3692 [Glarea lozoyensis 74030]|uniref:Uncharacterized protein n=1 Tax=Glarea lozoyensis (strain ATCC 74030 / MF5533) TaxID=1104152 RepID=H0EM64_GLAL7|nr:hypothetical protein M7I_3692 [Glarea lozoyensis 74030]
MSDGCVSTEPLHQDDYYCEGWAALRQCSIDGQHVLNSAAETRVPRVRGGPEEQAKAELQHDYQMGRWTQEDPRLRDVQRWVRARQ